MKTQTKLSWKTVASLENGEIALAHLGGENTTIFKIDATTVGILKSGSAFGAWFPLSNNFDCISLGKDWFLHVSIDPDLYPDNIASYENNSPLLLGPDGFIFRFRPFQSAQSRIFVSVDGGDPKSATPEKWAPVSSWSIWQNENSRLIDDEKPLIKFPASTD